MLRLRYGITALRLLSMSVREQGFGEDTLNELERLVRMKKAQRR